MLLEYEDGYVPQPHILAIHHLKTHPKLKEFIGKTVKDIKYPEGYSTVLIIFTDGSEMEISGEDCFNFTVNGI